MTTPDDKPMCPDCAARLEGHLAHVDNAVDHLPRPGRNKWWRTCGTLKLTRNVRVRSPYQYRDSIWKPTDRFGMGVSTNSSEEFWHVSVSNQSRQRGTTSSRLCKLDADALSVEGQTAEEFTELWEAEQAERRDALERRKREQEEREADRQERRRVCDLAASALDIRGIAADVTDGGRLTMSAENAEALAALLRRLDG